MPEKRSRGLGSLIASTGTSAALPVAETRLTEIPVDAVIPSSRQPRRQFRPDALASLADSIRRHGLLQPIIVRPQGEQFELVAGERRWRAAKLAGLEAVRAVVRPIGDAETLTLSIIENLQREDLDPIEEATAYRALICDLGLTHEQVATTVGKDRTTITNTLRLLELPPAIQARLVKGALSPGHARVLLAVTDPSAQASFAERAAEGGMSVRQLERLVYGGGTGARAGRAAESADILELERLLTQRLGVRAQLAVRETKRGQRGRLIVHFRSNQEFERILAVVGVGGRDL